MKNSEKELDQELVRKLVEYIPETGEFFWRERTPDIHYPRTVNYWNSLYAGKPAGTVNRYPDHSSDYLVLNIYDNRYQAHRIAYLYMEGFWPDIIDHLDGNGMNNKWENLRNVNTSLNLRNMKMSSRNTSGVVGVRYEEHRGKWHACFRADGKYVFVGRFLTKEEAVDNIMRKRKEHGFTERHGKKKEDQQ